MLLQDAAHPDVGRRLEVRAADGLAGEILRRLDAGAGVDEHKAMPEAAMQEHRDRGQRLALVARHVIGAYVFLAHIELVLAAHPPVPLARPHVGEEHQVETLGLNRAVDQRPHDVVVAARDAEPELRHQLSPNPSASLGLYHLLVFHHIYSFDGKPILFHSQPHN